MADEASAWLPRRFVSAVQPVLPLVSVWAHGSLAGGDCQAGRSDLDLIAILGRPCTAAEEQQLGEVHESLGSAIAFASRLHCSYCVAGELDDPARLHLTWAHEEFMRRPITPVTRRELHDFGLVLYGEEPAALLPPVTGEQRWPGSPRRPVDQIAEAAQDVIDQAVAEGQLPDRSEGAWPTRTPDRALSPLTTTTTDAAPKSATLQNGT